MECVKYEPILKAYMYIHIYILLYTHEMTNLGWRNGKEFYFLVFA